MPRVDDADPESFDLGGSGVPSTPVPPPPNPRASSASLPTVVVRTPQEELEDLANYCGPDGGIVEVFKRTRKRAHRNEARLQSTNAFVAQIKRDLGELPSALRDDSGSGALGMLAKQDKKLTKIENDLTDIAKDLREDREAREKADKARDKATADARAPWSRVAWIAVAAFVGITVTGCVGGVAAYIARNWNPPSSTSTVPAAPIAPAR